MKDLIGGATRRLLRLPSSPARTRRIGGLVTLAGIVLSLIMATGIAGAIDQTNPTRPTTTCGGVWHWVHNQTVATAGVLTAQFEIDGQGVVTISVENGPPYEATNLHYYIELDVGATLISAFDDVDDGNLVLSHWPVCDSTTTSSATSSTVQETTTTGGGTTSTTAEETTTTGSGVTPTTVEQTTTTESGVTPTTVEQTTTPEGEVSPSADEGSEQVTESTRLEVLETTITAPGSTISATAETLPFTGVSFDGTGGIAFALVALGGLMLLAYGYRPGEGAGYRGRHRRPSGRLLPRVF